MTLQQLIHIYRTEDYKFYKFSDSNGVSINTHFFFETHSDYLDKYLGFYKQLPDLTEVIVKATDGIFKLTNRGIEYFIRHNHQEVFMDSVGNQRGVSYDVSKQVRENIIKRTNDILRATNFDQIFYIVSQCKVKGFGELSIYDASLRIAFYMNIEPDKIFLHAGARKGAEILEHKGYVKNGLSQYKHLEMSSLPHEFQSLKPMEVEHFLCSKKEDLKYLNNKENSTERINFYCVDSLKTII